MSEEKFRIESDLLGELQVPVDAYYGVQTQRAINNYKISNTKMSDYPEYVIAMACSTDKQGTRCYGWKNC